MECDDIKIEIDASQYNQDEEEDDEEEPLSVAFLKYREFEDFSLPAHTASSDSNTLTTFIREWELRLAGALAVGCAYSDTVLAFKLLERVNSGPEELAAALDQLEAKYEKDEEEEEGGRREQGSSLLVRVKLLVSGAKLVGEEEEEDETNGVKEELATKGSDMCQAVLRSRAQAGGSSS